MPVSPVIRWPMRMLRLRSAGRLAFRPCELLADAHAAPVNRWPTGYAPDTTQEIYPLTFPTT
jgi:hypothetical protein